MNKILLAIQYWENDRAQAMEVARLIADLEPRMSTAADFLFVSRFDCEHDMPSIQHVARKFNVHHYRCIRRGQMWPHGCNELWFGTMDWVYGHTEAQRIPNYKAILTFEADASPLTPNWIQHLSDAWDKAAVKVFGAMITPGTPHQHVNGNGMFSGDHKFLHWVAREVGGCSPQGGWDYLLAPQFRQHGWANCPGIRSWWQTPTLEKEKFDGLVAEGAVFLHGIKDDSVVRHVRNRFLGGT